jgi:hypothetical protein
VIVPVVVSTGDGRGHWVADCLRSITRGNVTVCLSRTGGELGAIRMIHEGTHWSRWLLLQDSCEVLDNALFDLVDATTGSLLIAPRPSMYLAVYEREILDRIGIPDVPAGADRAVAIRHETEWMDQYEDAHRQLRGGSVPVLFPDFTDANAPRREHRHGRINLVLENTYLRKYKGTWH